MSRETTITMVRVASATSDPGTAWRIRDSLASHPLLGGGMANIDVVAGHGHVVLEGWVMDAGIRDLAVRLAYRNAGRRTVSVHMAVKNCRNLCTVTRTV